MSRQNKVNPDHYTMAGRLSADDLARERTNNRAADSGGRRQKQKPEPPWIANESPDEWDIDQEDTDVTETAFEGPANEDIDDALAGGPDVTATGERTVPAPKAKTARGAKRRAQTARRSGTAAARRAPARQEEAAVTRRRKPAARAAKKGRARKAAGVKKAGAGRPGARKPASRGTKKAKAKKGMRKR